MNNQHITTWEAVCQARGTDPKALPDVSHLPLPDGDDDKEFSFANYMIACYKLPILFAFFNQARKPDYTNVSDKYFAWFGVKATKQKPSGVGFSDSGTYASDSVTVVGSRLTSHDPDVVRHLQRHFEDVWKYHQLM